MTGHSAHGYEDPFNNPELPLVQRILLACWDDMDPEDVPGREDGDGAYDEVSGLIGDHDWHINLAIADTMGLRGYWGTDDVDEAVTNALHEYRDLRAQRVALVALALDLQNGRSVGLIRSQILDRIKAVLRVTDPHPNTLDGQAAS
jgi:hypothetical protein